MTSSKASKSTSEEKAEKVELVAALLKQHAADRRLYWQLLCAVELWIGTEKARLNRDEPVNGYYGTYIELPC